MEFKVSYAELQLLAELNSKKTFGKHQEDKLNACHVRIRQLNQRAQRNERLLKVLRERIEKIEESHENK